MQISALCPSATRVSLAWIPSGNALVSPALGNFRSLLVALRDTAIPRRKGTPAAAALPRQGGGWGADINALTVFFFFSFSASLFSFFSIRHEVVITFCLPVISLQEVDHHSTPCSRAQHVTDTPHLALPRAVTPKQEAESRQREGKAAPTRPTRIRRCARVHARCTNDG